VPKAKARRLNVMKENMKAIVRGIGQIVDILTGS